MKAKIGTIESGKSYVVIYWCGTFDYGKQKEVRTYGDLFELPKGVNFDQYIEKCIRDSQANIINRKDWSDIKIIGTQVIESMDEVNIVLK